jgi:hypothetical protein
VFLKATVILLTLTVTASALGAEVYECVDAKGNLKFTNRSGDSVAGCKAFRYAPVTTQPQPKPSKTREEEMNAAAHALTDPDERVREKAQEDFDRALNRQ